jgi:hypothetical protein
VAVWNSSVLIAVLPSGGGPWDSKHHIPLLVIEFYIRWFVSSLVPYLWTNQLKLLSLGKFVALRIAENFLEMQIIFTHTLKNVAL